MKRIMLVGSLLPALLATPATAQVITFEASDIESVIGQHTQTSVYLMNTQHYPSLTTILNATGPGQTYDFSPYTYGPPSGVSYEVLSSAAGTPGENDPDFGGANWVQKQDAGGDFYSYSDLRDDGFFLLGSITVLTTDLDGDGMPDQTVQKNDPPDPTYVFPLTDGTAWNQEYVSTIDAFGVTTTVTTTVDFAVEGWGTLITPVGSAPALRLRKTLTVAGPSGYTTTSYLFITKQLVSAVIILDEQGAVFINGASYSVTGAGGPTAVEEVPAYPFHLEQNYPNPFNGSTSIAFSLERPGYVGLRVFDLLGREVSRLVDKPLPAGSHTAAFQADGLPSGVYLYRLEVDGIVSERQLVLRK